MLNKYLAEQSNQVGKTMAHIEALKTLKIHSGSQRRQYLRETIAAAPPSPAAAAHPCGVAL